MAEFDLSGAKYRIIQPCSPNKPRGVAPMDDRCVLSAAFFILRTGSLWRNLPERYGPCTMVNNRFNRWAKADVWKTVYNALAGQSSESMASIDSSNARV